jgi:hypothetical protein
MGDLLDECGLLTDADDVAEVELPHRFKLRKYQEPVWEALFGRKKKKRLSLAWHRRAGKDVLIFNAVVAMATQRVGNYHYYFPTYGQGRKAIFDGIITDEDGHALRFLDFIPPALITNVNGTEMKISLASKSIIQIIGVDAGADLIVGTNPICTVFSEFALHDPTAWQYVRPILAENGGTAIFISTFRGRNHFYQMHEAAKTSPDWFTSTLTVDDTRRANGKPVISLQSIESERSAGMPEDLIQQEFYCSPTAIQGAYYGAELERAYEQDKVCRIPIEQTLDVETYWDLGIADATAIIFVQKLGLEIRIIDYYENSGEGLTHYANYLKDWAQKHQVRFGAHYAPHDIEVRELTSGESRKRAAMKMGIKFYVVPKIGVMEGIDMGRRLFPRLWFDKDRCEVLLSCLAEYRKKWNEQTKTFSDTPLHDHTSHAADSFRYLAVATRPDRPGKRPGGRARAKSDFDVFAS